MSFPALGRLLALAEKLAAPDLRKLAKAQNEQAEIDAIKKKYETCNANQKGQKVDGQNSDEDIDQRQGYEA